MERAEVREERTGGSGLIEYGVLPAGVTVIRQLTDGTCMLACSHDHRHLYPLGGWCGVDRDSSAVRPLLVGSEAQARDALAFGEDLDYLGTMRCRICGGDEYTTDTFNRPVQMRARVKKSVIAQEVLF